MNNVIDFIPIGRPVMRWELVAMSGLSDRAVRKQIQKAKEDGILIINRQDGNGYQRVSPEDIPELRRQYKQNLARIISLSKQQKTIRAILKEAEDGINEDS